MGTGAVHRRPTGTPNGYRAGHGALRDRALCPRSPPALPRSAPHDLRRRLGRHPGDRATVALPGRYPARGRLPICGLERMEGSHAKRHGRSSILAKPPRHTGATSPFVCKYCGRHEPSTYVASPSDAARMVGHSPGRQSYASNQF